MLTTEKELAFDFRVDPSFLTGLRKALRDRPARDRGRRSPWHDPRGSPPFSRVALHLGKNLAQKKLSIRLSFAMLGPAATRDRYILFAQYPEPTSLNAEQLGPLVDQRLRENYHWDHARRCGQIQPIEVRLISDDAIDRYHGRLIQIGHRPGNIKFFALRRETDWEPILCARADGRIPL